MYIARLHADNTICLAARILFLKVDYQYAFKPYDIACSHNIDTSVLNGTCQIQPINIYERSIYGITKRGTCAYLMLYITII